MSVENREVIDFISITTLGKVALSISDHLEWEDNDEHLLILQDKINAYLDVIQDGQIYNIYPDAIGKKIIIQVAMKYRPNKKAEEFLENVKEFLEDNNYEFMFYHLKEDQ